MKTITNGLRRLFASRHATAQGAGRESSDSANFRESLNRETRRNLAAGMSLREAVQAAQAKLGASP